LVFSSTYKKCDLKLSENMKLLRAIIVSCNQPITDHLPKGVHGDRVAAQAAGLEELVHRSRHEGELPFLLLWVKEQCK